MLLLHPLSGISGGDNSNGESNKAGKSFFNTDYSFNIAEYFHFCNRLLKKEPKKGGERGKSSGAPCMIVFCAFQQMETVIRYAEKHGFKHYIPLTFIKNYSAQVLKANMRIVGATEHALVLYRDKLPKFNNDGRMIFDWFHWTRDDKYIYPKIHPTQKPVGLLKTLIEIFTDEGECCYRSVCRQWFNPQSVSGDTQKLLWIRDRQAVL